ncbi:MAG: hypothetical protein ACTS73_01205 [Arsenophonus sp. NEOnobi-MAG3]
MMSIHVLKELIPVYPANIITVNMLSTGDIHEYLEFTKVTETNRH